MKQLLSEIQVPSSPSTIIGWHPGAGRFDLYVINASCHWFVSQMYKAVLKTPWNEKVNNSACSGIRGRWGDTDVLHIYRACAGTSPSKKPLQTTKMWLWVVWCKRKYKQHWGLCWWRGHFLQRPLTKVTRRLLMLYTLPAPCTRPGCEKLKKMDSRQSENLEDAILLFLCISSASKNHNYT